MTKKKTWTTLATSGLILVGFGLCLTIDAAFTRYEGAATSVWATYGTVGLVVFNTGLSLFGRAVVEQVKNQRKEV